ncbi:MULTISPECIES: helix-turn-helix domain-containing protein [Bradyrhizobium]|uniref:Transcriptional regulator with XRE-family HTH domain n=2 Tax=Bradyrhizobium TaxID=374 RepID=A0ABV4FHM8_9BRAD|nr:MULTISPECIES: helix-turn-helix transcriptional regulator [Bradyrhizobium]MBC9881009.1 helix-turn-helix transcriptional regulator [Bradyrhizobium campsiandrae]MBC9981947.1 helix-turn-helix domain-containing protein [Bradyrhizobium campsiandrae]
MSDKKEQPPKLTFGKHLARLRDIAGLTLRQVEEATGKDVSNAYLSQLENDKIAKPSPNVLHVLAGLYKTSYEDLMDRAGYLSAENARKAATFAVGDLTPDEEKALMEYLAFIRKQTRA